MESLLTNIDIPFMFRQRPTPLAGDLRPAWRMSLVLLILHHSRGKKATLQKLHVLNSACHSLNTRRAFLNYVHGKVQKYEIIPRIEPSLNRALNLLRGEGLVEIEKGKNIILTPVGLTLSNQLVELSDCLELEKTFLQAIESFATEGRIGDLFTWNVSI
ncbi:MAG: hypothetical protein IPP94_07730 [Ignavibacteria bacterium]|nr:hypothetical protein [Ignavibacteria bacterium]